MTLAPSTNRRTHTRFAIQTTVRFRIAGSGSAGDWKRCRSGDMSASGILLETSFAAPAGTRLELVLDWTGLYHGRDTVQLHVIAAVVRTGRRRMAVRILNHRFHCADFAIPRNRRTAQVA